MKTYRSRNYFGVDESQAVDPYDRTADSLRSLSLVGRVGNRGFAGKEATSGPVDKCIMLPRPGTLGRDQYAVQFRVSKILLSMFPHPASKVCQLCLEAVSLWRKGPRRDFGVENGPVPEVLATGYPSEWCTRPIYTQDSVLKQVVVAVTDTFGRRQCVGVLALRAHLRDGDAVGHEAFLHHWLEGPIRDQRERPTRPRALVGWVRVDGDHAIQRPQFRGGLRHSLPFVASNSSVRILRHTGRSRLSTQR